MENAEENADINATEINATNKITKKRGRPPKQLHQGQTVTDCHPKPTSKRQNIATPTRQNIACRSPKTPRQKITRQKNNSGPTKTIPQGQKITGNGQKEVDANDDERGANELLQKRMEKKRKERKR